MTQRETFCHTEASIDSLYATTRAPFDLVYVDGGSPPAVRKRIEAAAQRRGFRVLRCERFLSPNEARNLALAASTGEFVVFVDNDLIFGDGWLERLVECADETGAEIVGSAHLHRTADVQENPCGRRQRAHHGGRRRAALSRDIPLPHRQLADVADLLVRQPLEMVELHCMLVRRTVFDRAGLFDERLLAAHEHADLCMLVRAAGGTVMFEPASIANQLLPAIYPFDRDSLPFFRWRWSRANCRATAEHFRAKWNLASGDTQVAATENWCNDRRDVLFRYLRPRYFRHGSRRLRRALAGKMRL